jgi:PDZ domain-containing secreted protein
MKKLVREYWKLILILLIPYLFILVASVVKVNYDIVAPATITNVSKTIDIEDNKIVESNVNVVSVYSYSKVSLLNYLIAKG